MKRFVQRTRRLCQCSGGVFESVSCIEAVAVKALGTEGERHARELEIELSNARSEHE